MPWRLLPEKWRAADPGVGIRNNSMKFSDFEIKIRDILAQELPPGNPIISRGRLTAKEIKIGRTLFMDKHGVSSEAEYKQQCIRDKKITFHAHIGLNSWAATADALKKLDESGTDSGFKIDRAGICLDRRMGLPQSLRRNAPAETGPMLTSADDWLSIGQAAPIQPHMGDFMIGFPSGVSNTILALGAGVTTIGNLSQFFSHEVPNWKDHVTTTVETIEAISIMGGLRHRGTLVHSYLEDGYGALFYDCATIAGWAFLEKYIVETLMGAKLTHCIGGLTTDPVKRAGWVFALDMIHDHDCLGSMIYGDTISFTQNPIVNAGLVSEYLLWDILAQMACPTGHALLPLPLTEGMRIPSVQEIEEAQQLGNRVLQTAQRIFDHVDLTPSRLFAKRVVTKGKQVFENALAGLKEAGVKMDDPVELLFVLKKMGPAVFEEMFGAGTENMENVRKHDLVIPTDVFEMSQKSIETHRSLFMEPANRQMISGKKLLIASTDVHEHAILVLNQLCKEAGARVYYLGAEKNPDEVVAEAVKHKVDGVLLSTHNGMALDYANRLKQELQKCCPELPIIFGGILNQKMENCELPVDVSFNIKKLGFIASGQLQANLIGQLGNKIE